MRRADPKQMSERLKGLIDKAEDLVAQKVDRQPNGMPIDEVLYQEWRSQSLNALREIAGEEHTYTQEFQDALSRNGSQFGSVSAGYGILRALYSDICLGDWQHSQVNQIRATLDDLLDIANELMVNGSKSAAAAIASAALEIAIDALATSRNLVLTERNVIAIINDLANQRICQEKEKWNLIAWAEIRSNVYRGRNDVYSRHHVRNMIEGLAAFVGEHVR